MPAPLSGSHSANITTTSTTETRGKTIEHTLPITQSMYGNDGAAALPEYLKGVWRASLMSNGAEVIVNLALESDGTMTLLREPPGNNPPILAKGGYILSRDSEDSFTLCYLVSSPSHGTMPYDGCVKLWSDGTGMILEDKGQEFRYLLMMGEKHLGFEKIR